MLSLSLASLCLSVSKAASAWPVEADDKNLAADNAVCGVYGDPHIEQQDGSFMSHMGAGEYQLLSIPSLQVEAHYYGCGVASGSNQGTFVGAMALRIGTVTIEIIGNDLTVVGGTTYNIDYDDDKVVGPIVLDATATTVTIEREVITTSDLAVAQRNDNKAEAAGRFLYRWTISTTSGVVVHSHAAKVAIVEGGWVLDMHFNYPESKAANAKGLCISDCGTKGSRAARAEGCQGTHCMPINGSATYGVAPIFSDDALAHMRASCPATVVDTSCPPEPLRGAKVCTDVSNVSLAAALLACVHLSAMSDSSYHDAVRATRTSQIS